MLLVTINGQASIRGVHCQTAIVAVDKDTYDILISKETKPLKMVDLEKPERLITDGQDDVDENEVPKDHCVKANLIQAWIYTTVYNIANIANMLNADNRSIYSAHKDCCLRINSYLEKYKIIIHKIIIIRGSISIADSNILKNMSTDGVM